MYVVKEKKPVSLITTIFILIKISTPRLYKICLYMAYNNQTLETKIINTKKS